MLCFIKPRPRSRVGLWQTRHWSSTELQLSHAYTASHPPCADLTLNAAKMITHYSCKLCGWWLYIQCTRPSDVTVSILTIAAMCTGSNKCYTQRERNSNEWSVGNTLLKHISLWLSTQHFVSLKWTFEQLVEQCLTSHSRHIRDDI